MQRVTDKEYWMDGVLKSNLDTAVYNLPHDFDVVGLITGNGMVRVGKSVLAQQIGYYFAYEMGTPFTIKNIVFSGEELMRVAFELPPNSVIIYDEARGELDNKKMMETVTKRLLDFFAECGYMNHILLLVLPDLFELPKGIAVNRSDFLINVFRSSEEVKNKRGEDVMKYKRGYFQFYNRERKKRLYIDGKKQYDDYGIGKPNFWGEFRNYNVIDDQEYRAKKAQHSRRERNKDKDLRRFAIALTALCDDYTQREVADILKAKGLDITQSRINQVMNTLKADSPGNEA